MAEQGNTLHPLVIALVLITFYSCFNCNKHRKSSSHLNTHFFFLQAVDRVGRTARRSMDTHIRNVFSQPRACTSIRRLSALFAFSADLRRLRRPLQTHTGPLTTHPQRPLLMNSKTQNLPYPNLWILPLEVTKRSIRLRLSDVHLSTWNMLSHPIHA
jgi:hypothetical protein